MKKFINIILTLGLIAFTASCVKEYGPHEPGPLDEADCYGVYFPVQEATGSHTYDPTMPTEVDVVVARKSASNDIVVPVEIVNESGIFNVGEIHFADGQSETVLHIDFPQAGFGEEYAMSVVISDPKYASKYNSGAISFDFSVMRVEWKKFVGPSAKEGESGHIYQICWEEDYDTDLYYYDTSFPGIRYCRLENAWHGNVETVDYVFYWDTKSNRLFVPHQWIGYNLADGRSVYTGAACDFYNAYNSWGEVCPSTDYFTWAPAWIDKNGFFQPYYDGNGNFYLADWLYLCNADVPTGSGYQFGGASEKDADLFMAPGFVRTDYSLEVETDFSDEGVVPFYFTAGVDVSAVKYVVKEGELTATQASKVADAIADGSEECQTISEFEYNEDDNVNEAYLEIEFEETNFYTLVAVSFDETGAPKASASATCFAVAAGDDSYDVQIIAGLEDTPARFQDFDRTSSLGFYITGKEITDLKFDIFKASDVKKAGLDAVVADIRESDSVDEEVLASVNSVGGFASVFDGLDALTEYTLVVWATNGSKDKVVVSSLATDGLPNEVIASGAFTGGALLFKEDFVTPTTVEYNPNTEHFEIPNFLDFDAPLVFDLNSDDNTIDVLPSYSGIDYAAGAPINVYEASDVYLDLTKYGLPADAHSYLDEETGKYFFCLAYYVPAAGGGFGAAYETFEVGESAEEVAENAESVTSTVSTVGCKPGVASLIRKPKVTSVRYERDPMSASFSVKSVSAKVRNRNVEKNHSLIRINNTDVIF